MFLLFSPVVVISVFLLSVATVLSAQGRLGPAEAYFVLFYHPRGSRHNMQGPSSRMAASAPFQTMAPFIIIF